MRTHPGLRFFKSAIWAVGADSHIGPPGSCEFAADFRKTGLFCRADVGIGPYGFMERLHKSQTADLVYGLERKKRF